VNGYLWLWLSCPLLSACCCWRLFYADLTSELNTHLALQALFTQSSPVCEPLLQAFPFPSRLGEVTLHPLSLACVFVYSSHGKWVFPLSCGVFLPLHFYKLSHSWLLGMCCCSCRLACLFTAQVGCGSSHLSCGVFLPLPLSQAFPLLVAGRVPRSHPSLSGQARLVYLQFWERFPSPRSALSVPHPLCKVSLLFLLLISNKNKKKNKLSFSFFPWVEVGLSRGYADLAQGCLGEYCVALSSPCPHLPKPSGHGWLAARGPSWFLSLMWSGDSLHGLEVWRGVCFASSQWFCLQGVSPASLQISL
jgi:hypothetical protein